MSEEIFTTRLSNSDVQDQCSFCGKAAKLVDRLIYAQRPEGVSRVAICNECVALYRSWLTPAHS
jgi:ClpX C4-type zinc finger